MAAVWIDGLWGYVDDSLSLTIPPQFRMAAHFSEGLAAVLDARGYSYIDRNSRLIIPGPFDSAGEFHEGVAVVYRDQKAYYIDKKGVPAVPDTYAHAGRFFHGVANVILNDGSSAYIDRAGKVVYKAKLH